MNSKGMMFAIFFGSEMISQLFVIKHYKRNLLNSLAYQLKSITFCNQKFPEIKHHTYAVCLFCHISNKNSPEVKQ